MKEERNLKSLIRKQADFIQEFSNDVEEINTIKAIITTFDNTDKVGDIMQKGCLDNFIRKFDNNETGVIKMLFNHDRNEILGQWIKFEIQDNKVIGIGKFSDVTKAKDIKTLIEDGILDSVSIGFKAIEWDRRDDDQYEYPVNFKEIEILETSIVDAPANPNANILETKEFNPRLAEKILRDFGFSKNASKLIIKNTKQDLKASEQCEVVEENNKILEVINNTHSFKEAYEDLQILKAINN